MLRTLLHPAWPTLGSQLHLPQPERSERIYESIRPPRRSALTRPPVASVLVSAATTATPRRLRVQSTPGLRPRERRSANAHPDRARGLLQTHRAGPVLGLRLPWSSSLPLRLEPALRPRSSRLRAGVVVGQHAQPEPLTNPGSLLE